MGSGRITFQRRRGSVEVEATGTLLDAARKAGVPLASSCGGLGVCDACRVRVVSGGENLSAVTDKEVARGLPAETRLACQACILGPATITTAYW